MAQTKMAVAEMATTAAHHKTEFNGGLRMKATRVLPTMVETVMEMVAEMLPAMVVETVMAMVAEMVVETVMEMVADIVANLMPVAMVATAAVKESLAATAMMMGIELVTWTCHQLWMTT